VQRHTWSGGGKKKGAVSSLTKTGITNTKTDADSVQKGNCRILLATESKLREASLKNEMRKLEAGGKDGEKEGFLSPGGPCSGSGGLEKGAVRYRD